MRIKTIFTQPARLLLGLSWKLTFFFLSENWDWLNEFRRESVHKHKKAKQIAERSEAKQNEMGIDASQNQHRLRTTVKSFQQLIK